MSPMNLTHHFLIAMPAMADPHFSKTLTFICEHNAQGALGIVINRPIEMNLAALLEQVSIPLAGEAFKSVPIHFGGPVQVDRGFVLHTPLGSWQSTLAVSSEIGLTTSKDILQAVARGEGPGKLFVTLGYAGWAPGQLEAEVAAGAWWDLDAEPDDVFSERPDRLWHEVLRRQGGELALLATYPGDPSMN